MALKLVYELSQFTISVWPNLNNLHFHHSMLPFLEVRDAAESCSFANPSRKIEPLRDDYAGKTVISPYREERRGNAIQTDKSVTFGVRWQQFHSKLISLGAN